MFSYVRFKPGSQDMRGSQAWTGVGNKRGQNFPGGGVVRTLPFTAGGACLILDWRTKIPHAFQPRKKKKNRHNIVTNSVKTLRNDPHQNNLKKIKESIRGSV